MIGVLRETNFKVDRNTTSARKRRFRQCLLDKETVLLQYVRDSQILESGGKHLYVYRTNNRCLIYD